MKQNNGKLIQKLLNLSAQVDMGDFVLNDAAGVMARGSGTIVKNTRKRRKKGST